MKQLSVTSADKGGGSGGSRPNRGAVVRKKRSNKCGHQTDHNNVNDAAGRARTTRTQHATYLGIIAQGVESAPQRSKREVTHLSEIKLLVI